jgi:hypothetical protein
MLLPTALTTSEKAMLRTKGEKELSPSIYFKSLI